MQGYMNNNYLQNGTVDAVSEFETDTIVKGIEISWTTWGKMRGERLVEGNISYLKSEGSKGFERIYSVNIKENQNFAVGQMIAHIKAGILPDSILITPKTNPSNLAEILADKGFVIDVSDPCMLLYMDDFTETTYADTQFSICGVTSADELGKWLNIVNEALFEGELVTEEQFSDVLKLDNTYFYMGYAEKKPVAACMTIIEGDTAVLEMAAVLKEFRRRGYASRLVGKALADLKEKGIRTVSLRAETAGIGVYKRLGFKVCFNRVAAFCDWKNIYEKACPCYAEKEKAEQITQLYERSDSLAEFVLQIKRRKVLGRDIYYKPEENAVYISKQFACDCGGGCPSNSSETGRKCHCDYVNHLTQNGSSAKSRIPKKGDCVKSVNIHTFAIDFWEIR